VAAGLHNGQVGETTADRSTAVAFLGIVLFGGLNGLAVKLTLLELDPFWGAALRLIVAAALLGAIMLLRRLPLPRGRALIGSLLYGLLGFAAFFALMYYGLVDAPAGLVMVILALVPLLTLLLAVVHGLEPLRRRGLAGALLAIVGVLLIFGERVGAAGELAVPLPSLLAVVAASVVLAESGVAVKYFPRAHPVVNNAIAMTVGGVILLAAAVVAGERLALPAATETVVSVAYLVIFGSIGLFMLFLYVIERWTASATSYALLLMPLVTILGGAIWLAEPITPALLGGGALVLAGVYFGAFAPSFARPLPGLFRRPAMATAGGGEISEPPVLSGPNCP
jgi:drug/metabolite transporter (DMT)-like permease